MRLCFGHSPEALLGFGVRVKGLCGWGDLQGEAGLEWFGRPRWPMDLRELDPQLFSLWHT